MMTESPRTMQLLPADWRQLVLLNLEQLHGFISEIHPMTEAGVSALTDQHMAIVEAHVARGQQLLGAWRKSRMPGLAAPVKPAEAKAAQTNGAEPVKRRGGWPKGKSRKPVTAETQQ